MARQFVLPDLGEGLTEAEIVAVLVREGDVIQEDAPCWRWRRTRLRSRFPPRWAGASKDPRRARPDGEGRRGARDLRGRGQRDRGRPLSRGPSQLRHPPQRHRPAQPARRRQLAPAPRRPPLIPQRARSRDPLHPQARARAGRRPPRGAADRARAAASPTTTCAPPPRASVHARARGGGPAEVRPPPRRHTPLAPRRARATALPRFEQWGPVERAPLSHLRRTIAERMTLSASVIPHVTHFDRADITDLDALIRNNLEAARARGVTLTLTGFLLKAAAVALAAHPQFNASLDAASGELILKRYHHLGIAVATERGLIVPVIRDVDKKPLLAVARELAALAQRVREGKATLDDLRGGTFTITNIGALGGTGAIPIINYPEVAILAVARAREEPVVRGGTIVPRLILPLTLTFDHRVADGADGARLAADLVRLLEHPDQLLLEL